ncbi:C-3 sterol dehydrogenase/C-4 decarboxylase, partial [Lophiotrema nucula]
LVVGGVGFVGCHLVSYFIEHGSFERVAILSRSAATSRNRVEGAEYYVGDVTKHDEIRELLKEVKPAVVIHAASPSPVTGTPKEYESVNISGTANLLNAATESEHVRAFIYTASSTMAKGPEHRNLDEAYPLANTDPKASAYARSKATAETTVLDANKRKPTETTNWAGYLATASLRFPIIYGLRDETSIPGCLNALSKGQTNTTLGNGLNLWDFCSSKNCSISHVLLAAVLLSSSPNNAAKVDGEAFNINDGSPYPFWGFARLCWKYAGYDPQPFPKVTHLPSWFALGLATFLEWLYWIFTFGTKRPYNLGRQQVEYACFTHTYSIEKAKTRLGFKPQNSFEADVKEAVDW